jgi:tetratricopeptide (TPR) repeat protein/cold shock CspA family protein
MSQLLEQAELAAQGKRWEEAARLLEQAGESVLVLSRRGFYLSRAADFVAAQALFEQLAAREPSNAKWPYMVGYQLAQQERYDQAIPWFSRALRLDGQYLKAWYRVAKCCQKAGRDRDAQLAALRVLRIWNEGNEELRSREAEKMARACYLLARMQLRGDPSGAVELLRQGLEHLPRDPHFRYLIGKALRRSGQPMEAVEHLQVADRLAPRKRYQQLELAAALAAAGQAEQATKLLGQVSEGCRDWDAYNAGRLALAMGDPQLAVGLLERAASSRPCRKHPGVQSSLAEARAQAPAGISTEKADWMVGKVVLARPEKSFGFIEDEQGTRRHFRLRAERLSVRPGDQVRFRPVAAAKGPAAADVQPVG